MGLRKRIESRKFTDERMNQLLASLSRSKSKFWKAVGKKLTTPSNRRAAANLNKLSRNAGKGIVLVVPGKVLSAGEFSAKADIAAYSFSKKAAEKIKAAGSRVMTLEEFLAANPEGKKAKMVI